MAFRSLSTLEEWVEEFRRLDYPTRGAIRVMPQDGADDADTGLVGFRMPDSPTEIYVQPLAHDSREWVVTFEPREEDVTVPAATVQLLANEMSTLAALCAFLQAKSLESGESAESR